MRSFTALSILSFLLKVCVLVYVEGRYVVEVRLNEYTNPTGQCGDCEILFDWIRTCCDVPPEILPINITTDDCIGERQCDSYFNYCLRPFGDEELDGCSASKYTTSAVNSNDGPLNFSQSRVLGLSNPQVLSGLRGAYKGVQVYVEILDEDTSTSTNNLVDKLLIDHNQTVAQPLHQNHTGVYNFVTMDLTITVLCAENFGGSNCTQCVPGLTGPDCNETDHCSGVSYSDNGICRNVVNSFQCMCSPGFTGLHCEININDCVGVDCTGNVDIDESIIDESTSAAPGRDNTVDGSDTTATSVQGGVSVSAIAGGVVGALLAAVVLLILVMITVVIILKHYNNRREVNKGNVKSGPLPGDNPVYEQGNTTRGDLSLNTRTPVTTLPEEEGTENGTEERNFDNFIYGDDDDIDDGGHIYMAPFDLIQQDQQSLHDSHEFDNPIYGTNTSNS